MWGDRARSLGLDRVLLEGVMNVSRKRPDNSTNWKMTKLANIRYSERIFVSSDDADEDEENIRSRGP